MSTERFTSVMASAIAAVQHGVSLSVADPHLAVRDRLLGAHRQTPCVSTRATLLTGADLSITLCLSNGTARWACDGCGPTPSHETAARHRPELDALVNPEEPFTWSTVASSALGASARLMSTSHFLGEDEAACQGSAPRAPKPARMST